LFEDLEPEWKPKPNEKEILLRLENLIIEKKKEDIEDQNRRKSLYCSDLAVDLKSSKKSKTSGEKQKKEEKSVMKKVLKFLGN